MIKCIIIEDEPLAQEVIKSHLQQAGGFSLTGTYRNAPEAKEALEKEAVDLIFLDIQLPGIDGYETTRRVKQDPSLRQTPVIAVTSYALSGDDVKAFAAGCDAYVTKPFDPAELLEKIREHLG